MRATSRPTSAQILTVLFDISGIALDTIQSPTQLRMVGQVRAAAAHLLRVETRLLVKQVAPLLGRSDQTVCEFSRKARLALAEGGPIADLIEQATKMLDDMASNVPELPLINVVSIEGGGRSPPETALDPGPQPAIRRRTPQTFPLPHLAVWRVRTSLTQMQLAQRSGIVQKTIALLEKGRPARRDTVMRLASGLLLAPSVLTGTSDHDRLTGEVYRECRTCHALRPKRAFVQVKGTSYMYLRCRACRAKRARDRYYSSPEIHEAEVARARKNGKARRLRLRLAVA